jgi:NitT/TauT family transport system permease protein
MQEATDTDVQRRRGMPPPAREPSWLSHALRGTGWRLGVVAEGLAFLLAWQLFTTQWAVLPPKMLPPPSHVWDALVELASTGTLIDHSAFTLQNFVIGFALSAAVGIPAGILLGGSAIAELLFAPPLWALYAVPRVALAPLFIIIFGLGAPSKIAVVFSLASLPILVSTLEGMKNVPPTYISAARVYGASRGQVIRKVVLRAILPYIFVGLRIGVAGAIAGAIVGEFIGSFEGLGMLLARASYSYNIARSLALVLIVIIMAVLLMMILEMVRRRMVPWDDSHK